MTLVCEGGLILADNTLPDAVLDEKGDSGTKRYNAASPRTLPSRRALRPCCARRG
ncbi:MAG: hypothetical protein IPM07_27715 [Anaerolineales bacterium]|nr:hypothetical protein [Anaerolineales bacterium]